MFGDLFTDKEKEKCLDILQDCGLPRTGNYWWVRYPKRAITEIYSMDQNTGAMHYFRDRRLVWEEVIVNNYGTQFLLSIETNSNYPFDPPIVYVKDSEIDISDASHQYGGGALCLFRPDMYSSSWSIIKVRNIACSWCFCAESENNTGKWPGAEAPH